ncbi:hypothetical protein ABIF78_007686 [Bradyrhizobium japonicum]
MTLIKPTLDTYAATLEKTWSHDRMNTIGASEIGQCARKTYWIKNEDDSQCAVARDPDYEETWGARMRGTMFENVFWAPAMQARFGERLLFAGPHQKTFVHNFLSATPDGIIVGLTAAEQAMIFAKGEGSDCVMAECKTADPRTNLNDPKDENVYQTHVQMGLVRQQTPYRPTHSVLSYTDASFWSDVKEFVIPFNPDIYEAAQQRAERIMTATQPPDPEGWIAGGKECNYCPFTRACGVERRNLPFAADREVDPQFAAEIADMALELKRQESVEEICGTRVRELQEQIKNRLREKGVRKIPGVVSWSPVKGRAGIDNAALKAAAIAAGIDITKFATEGQPGDRLTIQISTSPS